MLNLTTAVFVAFFLFFFTLIIHEGGHALAAFCCKVDIQRIGLGLGKPWWVKKTKRYEWAFSPWLIGGYVRLLNTRIESVPLEKHDRSFDKKSMLVRWFILIAGAAANILVAWLALTALLTIGYQRLPPVIDHILPNSMASTIHLSDGDRFIQLNKKTVNSWQEVGMQLIIALGKRSVPTIIESAAGEKRMVYMDLSQWQKQSAVEPGSLLTRFGMVPLQREALKERVLGKTFGIAAKEALQQISYLIHFFCALVKHLIIGKLPLSLLLGPISVFTLAVHSFLQGITAFLMMAASLNLAVGFVNLLPIPGLDGSLMLYALLQKVRGKPLSIAMEILLHRLAVIFFSVLLVQLILNDLGNYLHSSQEKPL